MLRSVPGLLMSYRSVSFVPAVFACVVAGANLAAVTDLRAQAAADANDPTMQVAEASASCLSAPKGATPAGSHWYYRIDRVTKRQCWYLREESERSDDKFARAATPASTPAAAETSAAPLPTPRKFSEARAEYVARADAGALTQPTTRSIAAAPAPEDAPRAAMPNVLTPSPLSSMRWNEQPASPAPIAQNPPPVRMAAAAVPATLQSQPPVEQVQQPAAEQPLAPLAAEPARPTASLQKLMLVIAAALALAGITVSAIVRFGRMRARRAMKRKRSAMWDSTRSTRKKRPAQPAKQPNLQEPDARPRRAAAAVHPMRAPQGRSTPQDRNVQDLSVQGLSVQGLPVQGLPVQKPAVRELNVRELDLQDLQLEDRPPQDRPRQVRERPRAQPESYVPPNRRQVSKDRVPAERAPADRAPADRGPKERAPQQREHQVSEMLSRLARSAQN